MFWHSQHSLFIQTNEHDRKPHLSNVCLHLRDFIKPNVNWAQPHLEWQPQAATPNSSESSPGCSEWYAQGHKVCWVNLLSIGFPYEPQMGCRCSQGRMFVAYRCAASSACPPLKLIGCIAFARARCFWRLCRYLMQDEERNVFQHF